MYYVREEYKPWEPVQSKTLRGAKVAATRRAAYQGTTVSVAVKIADCFVSVCEKKSGEDWNNFGLIQ